MRSAPKRHVALTSIPVVSHRTASGNRRIRRETPLVAPTVRDLELCRTGIEAAPSSRVQARVRHAHAPDDPKLQASLRSAYRPKPAAGGGYSVVITDAEDTSDAAVEPRAAQHRSTAGPRRP